MEDDPWAGLVEQFADGPASVLDAGTRHQSLLLAQAGYTVILLDPSPALLGQA